MSRLPYVARVARALLANPREGLERARHLWSIDLPPLLEPGLARERGAAVPPDRRTRWTLVDGSSRRRLPSLLAELRSLQIFIHDSMHTERNLRFELDRAWRVLTPASHITTIARDAHISGKEPQRQARSLLCNPRRLMRNSRHLTLPSR